ncbi:hypothetical protein GLAREA_12156 [Glarea lozoyensis ATCC 20868]|uniref:Uncharacterized protein n=1 Tax=Glarea lozoyensis (strain ATCC 20868 / MF5171) TaxID=1116229 RepID=S3D4N8_GLAL2|nr:uncharacterized protein GLAREA_12156 [Glarea lozoyensis ATCC 20868]EPE32074.1 hypothetical protein GLAREA_12156 [Glarea lozoyensis ATCC 20868]
MTDLKVKIESKYQPVYPLVFLSIPDMFITTRAFADQRFEKAARAAGFELFMGGRGASRSALDYYKIEDCQADDPSSSVSSCVHSTGRVDDVLAISFEGTNLVITLLSRWNNDGLNGLVWPEKQEVNFELGFNSDLRIKDPEIFWGKIKQTVESILGDHKLDRVILSGDSANELEFRRTVRDTLQNLGRAAFKEISVPGDAKDFDENLYVAARGAANNARRGMMHGFIACIYSVWCEKVEEIPEILDTRKLKSEL